MSEEEKETEEKETEEKDSASIEEASEESGDLIAPEESEEGALAESDEDESEEE